MTTQNIKVGEIINTKYVLPRKGPRYTVGQKVDVFDKDTHKKTATFEVLEENGVDIKGVIINTYGHTRKKKEVMDGYYYWDYFFWLLDMKKWYGSYFPYWLDNDKGNC